MPLYREHEPEDAPVLIIANGEPCSTTLLSVLLIHDPFVIVLDNAIYRATEMGIKINAWLGDFDETHDFEQVKRHSPHIEIVRTPDQELRDFNKAIDFAIQRGYQAANIVWATGRRADHAMANMTDIVRYKGKIDLVLWDDYSKIFAISSGFERWYKSNTPISLMPIGIVAGIKTTGLKYDLGHEELSLGYRHGCSNSAAQDGVVTISFNKGDMLLMECNDLTPDRSACVS